MGYLMRQGGDSFLIYGTLRRDATSREFDSGFAIASFSLLYGHEPKLYGDGGTPKGKYLTIKAFGREGDRDTYELGSCLERGDCVLVCGTLKKDKKPDNDGNDRWYLDAKFISVQQKVSHEEQEPYYQDEEAETEEPAGEYQALSDEDYPEVLQ